MNIKVIKKQGASLIAGLWLLLVAFQAQGQINVSGPACIVPGSPYQYVLNGSWTAGSTIRVCVTGGHLIDSSFCSADTGVVSSVLVIWEQNASHRIDVTSSNGPASLIVNATTELEAGQVSEYDKIRVYDTTHSIFTFHCSAPTGGTCSPAYRFQWQKSSNGVNWTDIPGATDNDLIFTEGVLVTTFLRRVTFETVSHTVGYSDHALLVVQF